MVLMMYMYDIWFWFMDVYGCLWSSNPSLKWRYKLYLSPHENGLMTSPQLMGKQTHFRTWHKKKNAHIEDMAHRTPYFLKGHSTYQPELFAYHKS